jgi:stage V sporulation protein G
MAKVILTPELVTSAKGGPNCLPITNVQVYPLGEEQGKTAAFARVVLADQLQLTGLRVIRGSNGLFVAYPNDPTYKGEDYKSIYYPVTKELRDSIEAAVLMKFVFTAGVVWEVKGKDVRVLHGGELEVLGELVQEEDIPKLLLEWGEECDGVTQVLCSALRAILNP